MTKRDFFILLLKIFGLFSLVTSVFSVLPNNISLAFMDLDIISILWLLAFFILVFGLFILLIFKSDKVVTLLKLDKGFDEDRIELGSLNSSEIIKICVFIIGGLLFLSNVPSFLSHSFFGFKGDVMGMEYNDMQFKFDWAVSTINLIIGFLLLRNYKLVAKVFSK